MHEKTILFDLDGTLIDSTVAILSSFDYAFKMKAKVMPSHESIKALIGFTLEDIFLSLGIEESELSSYISFYKESYQKIYLNESTLLAGVNEALELAFDFADLAVVTTKTSQFSRILLEHLGVVRYFKAIVGREDVLYPKPSAEPLLKALNILNKNKNNTFMVGDTHLDLEAALAAEIFPIALTCGYESEQSLKNRTSYVFASALEAVKCIKTL